MKPLAFLLIFAAFLLTTCGDDNQDNDKPPDNPNIIWQADYELLTSGKIIYWAGSDKNGTMVHPGNYRLILEVETSVGDTILDTVSLNVSY